MRHQTRRFNKPQPQKMNRAGFLDLNHPKIQSLSEQFNLTPKTVAYIRTAFLENKYSRDSLIAHIQEENARRYRAIQYHEEDELLSTTERADIIRFTQSNIDFREGVISVLDSMDQETLEQLLA